MIDDTQGLSLEPDRSSRRSIGLRASPAEVYRTLVDPKELSRWFVSEASIDLRPGGAYLWVFGEATGAPGAGAQAASGEVALVVPQELLRLRARVEDLETDLEFRLDPWKDGTVLTVTHSGFPGEEEWDDTFRSIDLGWESELHILKIYLEKARGMVRRSLLHQARLAAPVEAVFERFATQAGLEGWLSDRAAVEAGPGGELLLEWKGRPGLRGHFAVFDPDRFLMMTWEEAHPSAIRLWLEEADDSTATDLSLEHRLFAPENEPFTPFDWEAALARLSRSIAAAPPG
jgi:uncharacterized protein YndB with AHSA1/START domain